MSFLRRLVPAALLFANVAATAFATTPLNYLEDNAVLPQKVLPSPPAAGSSGTQLDFTNMLFLQTHRSANDCARASVEANISLRSFFGQPYGSLTDAQVNVLNSFIGRVAGDASYFIEVAKDVWKRPRPYLTDKAILPCLHKEDSTAYPSGHSTLAETIARVLGQVDPVHAVAYQVRATQVAMDRVMGGVHHPTDTQAGIMLGDRIADALAANSEYKADLAEAKAAFAALPSTVNH